MMAIPDIEPPHFTDPYRHVEPFFGQVVEEIQPTSASQCFRLPPKVGGCDRKPWKTMRADIRRPLNPKLPNPIMKAESSRRIPLWSKVSMGFSV